MLMSDDSYKNAYDKWRNLLLRANLFLVILVFIVEFIMYFVLLKSSLVFQSTQIYMFDYFIKPSVANFLIIIIGHHLSNKLASDSKWIYYIPSTQLALCCMVVASTHYTFPVTLDIFCIPLFTTVIFSNSKLTGRIGILCSVLLALTLCNRRFSQDDFSKDIYFWAEAIVAYFILFGTIYVCNILIKFQEEKTQIIASGYAKQIDMQKRLNKDQKTGLYGATIFTNQLANMVKQSNLTNASLALAIIDIDDFKRINDTYGHLKGDQVILRLCELMKNNYKSNTFISRFGGEEFAIIISGNDTKNAADFLDKLRTEFQNQTYDFMNEILTISIGIAFWKPGWTSTELFENADAAMYDAKNSGKNKTTVYIQGTMSLHNTKRFLPESKESII